MLFPGGSPTLGSPVRGSLLAGQVQHVLFGPLPVQQQQLQQQQVQATAKEAGSPQQQHKQQVQRRQQQQQVQAPFQSPPPGPRTGFAFSSDFKNRIWPNQNSTIYAQSPDWAWLKDVTPAYLFEVAFYKFLQQTARQASIIFSQPLFRMKWMAAAHSILTFPLLFALSLFNEARVQVHAASRASSRTGCSMVRATVAGAFPINCTTRSRVPLTAHNRTRRTPWRP